jgi:hypothetical protein
MRAHASSGGVAERVEDPASSQRVVDGNRAAGSAVLPPVPGSPFLPVDASVPGRPALARPAGSLPAVPAMAARHQRRAGQGSQRGVRGRQNVAPTSMSAWVQCPGRSAGTLTSATAWSSRSPNAPGRPPTARFSTRRTFVSTAPTRRPKASAATARAV